MLNLEEISNVLPPLLPFLPDPRHSVHFDISALRRDYRDSITKLSNTAVHRKNVDNDMLACLRGWGIGEDVATLRCEYPSSMPPSTL